MSSQFEDNVPVTGGRTEARYIRFHCRLRLILNPRLCRYARLQLYQDEG